MRRDDHPGSTETGERPGIRFCDLKVHGFRAFGEFSVSGFERVNLFVGHNNVGKTSLLEALWCLTRPQNSQLPLQINLQRGLNWFALEGEQVWGWIFHEHRVGEPITLEATLGSEGNKKRRVTYRLEDRSQIAPQPPEGPEASAQPVSSAGGKTGLGALRIEYQLAGGDQLEVVARVTPKGIEGDAGPGAAPFDAVILLPGSRSLEEDVDRLSKVEELGRKDSVLRILKEVEPRLRDVSIGTVGGKPFPRADIGIGRPVPLALVGQGVNRLFSFAVAVAANSAGIVLIDEVENGLYYESLAGVWRGLYALARDLDVQLFVTTHSRECVEAAFRAFHGQQPFDLSVYRLHRENSNVRAIPFTEGALEAAFASDLEVR